MKRVSFKKGLAANIPQQRNEGSVYVTTDNGGMFVDIDGTHRIQVGQTKQDVENAINNSTGEINAILDEIIDDTDGLSAYNERLDAINGEVI